MTPKSLFDALENPEALEDAVTRRDALRDSGLLGKGLAMASVPVVIAAMATKAFGQGAALPNKIINALNFALLLEYLEDEFYRLGVAASGLIPASDRAIFQQVSLHETAHVAYLKAALGSQAVIKPTFDYTAGGMFNTFTDYPTFLIIAQGFEDTGVRAYKGQAGNVAGNGDILTAALRIHSVEARHASEIRRLRGQKGWIPTNDPAAPGPIKAVYVGEDNVVHLGVNVSGYEGVQAATEAFDEPFLREEDVLAIASPFFKR